MSISDLEELFKPLAATYITINASLATCSANVVFASPKFGKSRDYFFPGLIFLVFSGRCCQEFKL